MIAIVNYGLGNSGSILNMLRKVGCRDAMISSDPKDILAASKLILPGVGHFDRGMSSLSSLGFIEPLKERVLNDKVPILGICLGMQMFARHSEEGSREGLGLIQGEVVRFHFDGDRALKIPHMGWNRICFVRRDVLARGLEDEPRFYFVHSYHLICDDPEDILATTEYGYEFVSAVSCGHVLGVQFHPEKSHKYGMAFLRNFVELL
jgi:imidazole glycerol-phosphate synthase subunit HisH